MQKYDPNKHHRRSIRLRGWDYRAAGQYFVTICAYQRENLFGDVVDGEMMLSGLGEIVREEWLKTAVSIQNRRGYSKRSKMNATKQDFSLCVARN